MSDAINKGPSSLASLFSIPHGGSTRQPGQPVRSNTVHAANENLQQLKSKIDDKNSEADDIMDMDGDHEDLNDQSLVSTDQQQKQHAVTSHLPSSSSVGSLGSLGFSLPPTSTPSTVANANMNGRHQNGSVSLSRAFGQNQIQKSNVVTTPVKTTSNTSDSKFDQTAKNRSTLDLHSNSEQLFKSVLEAVNTIGSVTDIEKLVESNKVIKDKLIEQNKLIGDLIDRVSALVSSYDSNTNNYHP